MPVINLLVTDNVVGSAVMGIMDSVEFCNRFWMMLNPKNPDPVLSVRIYSNQGTSFVCSNGIRLPAIPLADYEPGDAVFIGSFYAYDQNSMEIFLKKVTPFNEVLTKEYERGAYLVSYCTGTFALAASGLLANRQATTVWWMKNLFRNFFPDIDLVFDELVVESDRIITGGATTSISNVFLKIVENLVSPQFAAQLSKLLLLDRNRLSQRAFMDPAFIINTKDSLVDDIQTWMFNNYQGDISLDLICDKFAVTKRTLNRRFKASCGETPLHYLQRIRVERAKHFLETTNMPVERIVEKVGYEDPASFRKLFVAQTQLTPKNYRQRFSYGAQYAG